MPARSTKPLSSTSFYVLLALVDAERYGLEIIDEIETVTDGEVRLGPGSLYNAIKRVLSEGLIEESDAGAGADPRRRYYRLTGAGLRQVTLEAQSFERLVGAAHAKKLLERSGS